MNTKIFKGIQNGIVCHFPFITCYLLSWIFDKWRIYSSLMCIYFSASLKNLTYSMGLTNNVGEKVPHWLVKDNDDVESFAPMQSRVTITSPKLISTELPEIIYFYWFSFYFVSQQWSYTNNLVIKVWHIIVMLFIVTLNVAEWPRIKLVPVYCLYYSSSKNLFFSLFFSSFL